MGIGPFAQGGLDEALGLAVGFWSVGAGEAVLEAEGGDLRRARRGSGRQEPLSE